MLFYYRTYIVWFTTSTNRFVYGGQHISKFINADDDDYRGSGRVILNALKKYGQDCIQFIQWFDHDSDSAMNQAEIELIADLKSCYKKQFPLSTMATGWPAKNEKVFYMVKKEH